MGLSLWPLLWLSWKNTHSGHQLLLSTTRYANWQVNDAHAGKLSLHTAAGYRLHTVVEG